MFRVVYTSRLSPGVGQAEIASIVRDSSERNAARHVTGAWLIRWRDCISMLEGPPREVRDRVECIWDDPRYSDFQIRDMSSSEHRLFPGQPMRFLKVTPDSRAELEADDGLRWLCSFAGGVEPFLDKGLSGDDTAQ